ncbi:MAG: hypothetical protein JST76_14915, partial [Bacteroidetes bacterium]|nr:hypothetical protein [Bacteroidota bacterium]
ETRDTSGQAEAKYPLTEDPERVLGNLTQGGLVLLKLYGTDHKGINISVDDDFLAAIRIQK